MPGITKRSVTIDGHRTSISLEDEFWTALKDIAEARDQSINALIVNIDETRVASGLPSGLSSAIRVFVLREVGQH